jgi:hypothetical protein
VFSFVQFEFAHAIGPEPGRYVVRASGEEPAPSDDPADLFGTADVLAIRAVGGSAARRGIRRRTARYEPPDQPPREVPVLLCTVIRAVLPFESRDAARKMLAAVRSSRDEQERLVAESLTTLNRAVTAHRICAGDPYAVDISRFDPRAVRIGYGDAETVVAGRWGEALSIAPPSGPRLPREVRLMPAQEMAAVLAGRALVLESEELVLRVMLDLEHGRYRAAAMGLRGATELLAGELPSTPDELPSVRERISALAERAGSDPLSEADVDELRSLVDAVGGLVDGWRRGESATARAGV